MRGTSKLTIAVVLFLLGAGSAVAQDGDIPGLDPEPSSAEAEALLETIPVAERELPDSDIPHRRSSRLVEEIVVTAQKREESLEDVPISVQAFSASTLEARGVVDQMGLAQATPGMDVGSQAGFATIFIRGVGTDAWLTADPSVAAYIDGVYYSFTPSIIQEFNALERVEVLKGPQGTLFGRNAVGGAINVVTKKPQFDEFVTNVDFAVENFGFYRTSFFTNLPLTDTWAINVSGFYKAWDSWLEGSTSAAKPLHKEVSSGVHAKLRWQPSDDLDVNAAVIRTAGQINGAFPVNRFPSLLGQALLVPAAGPYEAHTDERLYLNSTGTVFSGEIRYRTDFADIKLLGSDQHHTSPYSYDFDGSQRPLVSFDIPVHYADIRQAELQILSNDSSWGSDWLTFTAGVFYYENVQGFDPIEITVANLDPRRLGAIGVNLPDVLEGALDDLFGPEGLLGRALDGIIPPAGRPFYTVTNTALVETESLSGYLQLTADITDWFSLTLGGRYQNEKRGVKESNTRLGVNLFNGADIQLIPWNQARDGAEAVPLSATTSGFTPKVSLDFRPFSNETLIYASYQEAVKAHAYNAYAIYLRPAFVKPEETTAYEIGLKTVLFDGTTRLNAAAFLYETENLQTQFVSLINGGAVSFENAGNARSVGFDFDITSELLPSLIEGWALTLNGAYIDATYTEYESGSGFHPVTGVFSSNNDYTGNRQVRSPKYSGSVALTKTWYFDTGFLEAGTDYYYNAGFFYTASNDPKMEQPSFGLIGAYMTYTYDPMGLKFRVYGRNLTDEFYTNGLLATDFGTNYAVAPPRQYGVSVGWTF